MKQKHGYMVTYRAECTDDGPIWPMGWDDGCDGAICTCTNSLPVVFESKRAAQKALRISTANARLLKEQGKTYNEDFIEGKTELRIIKVQLPTEGEGR